MEQLTESITDMTFNDDGSIKLVVGKCRAGDFRKKGA